MHQELRRMEDQVAQSEQALRRCDRRRAETAKFLKRAPELPDAKTHLEEEELQESEQQLRLAEIWGLDALKFMSSSTVVTLVL